VNQL
jgi:hypothetical protein